MNLDPNNILYLLREARFNPDADLIALCERAADEIRWLDARNASLQRQIIDLAVKNLVR